MYSSQLWNLTNSLPLQTADSSPGYFDIRFDSRIPEKMRIELCRFINWVEGNYKLPIPLWVDFEYKHYLIDRGGKRVGFLFYWVDFSDNPDFENADNIPQILLPVRTEHSSTEEILSSFIEAITCYFAWICGIIDEAYTPNTDEVEEILQAYLKWESHCS